MGDDASGELAAENRPARSLDFTVSQISEPKQRDLHPKELVK